MAINKTPYQRASVHLQLLRRLASAAGSATMVACTGFGVVDPLPSPGESGFRPDTGPDTSACPLPFSHEDLLLNANSSGAWQDSTHIIVGITLYGDARNYTPIDPESIINGTLGTGIQDNGGGAYQLTILTTASPEIIVNIPLMCEGDVHENLEIHLNLSAGVGQTITTGIQ